MLVELNELIAETLLFIIYARSHIPHNINRKVTLVPRSHGAQGSIDPALFQIRGPHTALDSMHFLKAKCSREVQPIGERDRIRELYGQF